jgi:phage tail-like protein
MRQIPGLRKHPRVVMKRGLIASPKLFEWRKKVMDGIGNADDSEGKTQVTIHLLDEKRQPVFTWILRKAWPVKWAGPALAAGKNEASVEVMELVHEELKIE